MTPEEVKDYGERVEQMAKKEPVYQGWGFFYYLPVSKKDSWETTKRHLQHLRQLKSEY